MKTSSEAKLLPSKGMIRKARSSVFVAGLAIFLTAGVLQQSWAQLDTWTGSVSDDWNTSGNWSTGTPNFSSTAVINSTNPSVYPVTYSMQTSSGTIAGLQLGTTGTGAPAVNPQLDITANGFDVTGATALQNGAVLQLSNGAVADFTNITSNDSQTSSVTVAGVGSAFDLTVSANSFFGGNVSVTISNGAAFNVAGSSNLQFGRNLLGSSTQGVTTVVLTGNSSFANNGSTSISFGQNSGAGAIGVLNMSSGTFSNNNTLSLGDDRSAGDSGTVNVSGGTFAQTGATIIGADNGGGIAQSGTLSNAINFSGSSIATLGAVILGASDNLSTNTFAIGNSTVNLNASTTGLNGTLTMGVGTGTNGTTNSLQVNSGGTLAISNSLDYGLSMGNASNSAAPTANSVLIGGGSLIFGAVGSNHQSIIIATSGSATVNSVNSLTVSGGFLSASAGIVVGNTGNASVNTVTISGGTTSVQSGSSTPAILDLERGTATQSGSSVVMLDKLVVQAGASYALNGGTLYLNQAAVTPQFTVVGGMLNITAVSGQSGSGVDTFSNGLMIAGSGAFNGSGTVNGSVTYTSNVSSSFSGVIEGTGNTLNMSSVGTILTLSGTNTYTGGTTVTAGNLRVANGSGSATGTGGVSLGAAILSGTGAISGLITASGSGGSSVINPATNTSIGSLALNGGVSSAIGLTLNFAIDGTGATNSMLILGSEGLLVSGGTLTFNLYDLGANSLLVNTPYTIVTSGGLLTSGSIAVNLQGSNTYIVNTSYGTGGILVNGDTATFELQAVPEPSTLSMVYGIFGLLMLYKIRNCKTLKI